MRRRAISGARGAAVAALACLVAIHSPAALSDSLELADFNEEAGLPPGFSTTLDVTPELREALLRQAIGAGQAGPATGGPDAAWEGARLAPLVAVRLTIPEAEPAMLAERR